MGDARIGGKAQIYGKAKVMRGVVVHANAEILGDAQIQGVVNISQDARICSDEDYAAVQGFRTKSKAVAYRSCKRYHARDIIGMYSKECRERIGFVNMKSCRRFAYGD